MLFMIVFNLTHCITIMYDCTTWVYRIFFERNLVTSLTRLIFFFDFRYW